MINGFRYRRGRPGELGAMTLLGLVPEPVILDLDKAEVHERLLKAVQQGELEPSLLSTLNTAIPITVLETLGFTADELRKAEIGPDDLHRLGAAAGDRRTSRRGPVDVSEEVRPPRTRARRSDQEDETTLERMAAELDALPVDDGDERRKSRVDEAAPAPQRPQYRGTAMRFPVPD